MDALDANLDVKEKMNVVVKTNNLWLDNKIIEMKEYALKNNVPIIKDEGLIFIRDLLKIKRPINILEIGTAIGYSALLFQNASNANIYTIERDEVMYNEAIKNIKDCNKENKIHVTFADALDVYMNFKDIQFDVIFIDAAKAQYLKFFTLYTPYLKENGLVICDNMLFHGLVLNKDYENMSRSLRGLVKKLDAFREYLWWIEREEDIRPKI